MPRFVLASSSPRRHELLRDAGFEFEVISPDVSEIAIPSLTMRELTTLNATRKALAVAKSCPNALVLGADTLVALEGEVIGKPVDFDQAARILRRLSGRVHEVCSAVFICLLQERRTHSFFEISRVRFRRLSDGAIRDYLQKVDPVDKAGAYAAQGRGGEIIARIDGSISNVIGLPMEKTIPALGYFGIEPRRSQRRPAISGSGGAGM